MLNLRGIQAKHTFSWFNVQGEEMSLCVSTWETADFLRRWPEPCRCFQSSEVLSHLPWCSPNSGWICKETDTVPADKNHTKCFQTVVFVLLFLNKNTKNIILLQYQWKFQVSWGWSFLPSDRRQHSFSPPAGSPGWSGHKGHLRSILYTWTETRVYDTLHPHSQTACILYSKRIGNENLPIVDDDRSLSTWTFFSYNIDELKGVTDGAVRVRPARGLVLPYLQHIVILEHRTTRMTFNSLLPFCPLPLPEEI